MAPKIKKDSKGNLIVEAPGTRTKFNPETGRNDIYYGTGTPGEKAGHIVMDGDGNTQYQRDPGSSTPVTDTGVSVPKK